MKNLTCIMCPVGCSLQVEQKGTDFIVSGNGCIRGERYAISELTNPSRIVTSLVRTKHGICSVKTTNLIPKEKINDVLAEIAKLKPLRVEFGQILIKNVLNLNSDIVVTRKD